MVKGYLAGFQYCETTSGSIAAPTSPMPAERASGAMVCEVTDEWTGLNMFRLSCADNVMAKHTNNSMQNILGNVFILFSNSFLLLIKKRTG